MLVCSSSTQRLCVDGIWIMSGWKDEVYNVHVCVHVEKKHFL